MFTRVSVWFGLVAMLMALTATTATAQPAPDPPRTPTAPSAPTAAPPRARPAAAAMPWHKGVSPADKTKALALYQVGNAFFAKSQWSAALVKYAAAVKLWDHPGIRYNMAKCLMELKRYLESYLSLKLALRFGAAPLDPPRLYKEGKFLVGVLERLLARVRIVCNQPGVKVTLDGQPLFEGPGEKTRLIDPAKRHVVVATKHKHITVTRTLAPMPGRLTVVKLELMKFKKTLIMKRRWARWIGWTVLAAGVALAGVGAPLVVRGANGFDKYDEAFNAWCTNPAGCLLSDRPASLAQKFDRAGVDLAVGAVMASLGAVGITVGITLIILNIPRAVSPEKPTGPNQKRITVLPAFHRRGGSVTVTLSF